MTAPEVTPAKAKVWRLPDGRWMVKCRQCGVSGTYDDRELALDAAQIAYAAHAARAVLAEAVERGVAARLVNDAVAMLRAFAGEGGGA